MKIELFDRVSLADGRVGTVIMGDPKAGFFTVSLPGGKREYTHGAGLTPIRDGAKWEQVNRELKVELNNSLDCIERICYRS